MTGLPLTNPFLLDTTDTRHKTNHDWTSVYGPDEYDYSLEDPLIPCDPIVCPSSPETSPSSPISGSVNTTCRVASSICCPSSPMRSPTSDLGYNGRFPTPGRDHVILESIDEHKFSISKEALARTSGFFRNMFDLHPPGDSPVAIPTFVTAEDLYLLLVTIEDRVDNPSRVEITHLGATIRIPIVIQQLTLEHKVTLQDLADRFDCEAIGANLLAAASKSNLVKVARVGIIKMGKEPEWGRKASYHQWWKRLEGIRPSWQIELTKLFWEFQNELVNPYKERGRYSNGRRRPRSRETIMVQSDMSPEAIAAAFDPPKVSTVVV